MLLRGVMLLSRIRNVGANGWESARTGVRIWIAVGWRCHWTWWIVIPCRCIALLHVALRMSSTLPGITTICRQSITWCASHWGASDGRHLRLVSNTRFGVHSLCGADLPEIWIC